MLHGSRSGRWLDGRSDCVDLRRARAVTKSQTITCEFVRGGRAQRGQEQVFLLARIVGQARAASGGDRTERSKWLNLTKRTSR